jgi:hypothetical protein
MEYSADFYASLKRRELLAEEEDRFEFLESIGFGHDDDIEEDEELSEGFQPWLGEDEELSI